MKKEHNTEFIIKMYYSDENVDVKAEINRAILLFIEREVKKLCS